MKNRNEGFTRRQSLNGGGGSHDGYPHGENEWGKEIDRYPYLDENRMASY